MKVLLFLFASISTLTAQTVFAEVFKVLNDKLVYDTGDGDLEDGHETQLLAILKSEKNIKILVLNSSGGLIWVADAMADLVIDAGLNSHVEFECASSCARVFLAGQKRTMSLGGNIGFHKSYWEAQSMKGYYESEKEDEGWSDPFEFASWLYEDTQSDIFSDFEYLMERGVTPQFAIKTLRAGSDGMWYPRRKELLEGGILTQLH